MRSRLLQFGPSLLRPGMVSEASAGPPDAERFYVKSSLAGATGANVPSARPVRAPATPVADPRLSGQSVTPWLVVVLVVVLFSGGLFGHDQGVISGALHGIKARFSLSRW